MTLITLSRSIYFLKALIKFSILPVSTVRLPGNTALTRVRWDSSYVQRISAALYASP